MPVLESTFGPTTWFAFQSFDESCQANAPSEWRDPNGIAAPACARQAQACGSDRSEPPPASSGVVR